MKKSAKILKVNYADQKLNSKRQINWYNRRMNSYKSNNIKQNLIIKCKLIYKIN